MSFFTRKITVSLWQALLYIMVLLGLLVALLCCAVPGMLGDELPVEEPVEEVEISPKPPKPEKPREIIPPVSDPEKELTSGETLLSDTDSLEESETGSSAEKDFSKRKPSSRSERIVIAHSKSIINTNQSTDLENLPGNKSYYEGPVGTVTSELRDEEASFSEHLIIMNPEGEKVASLEIARLTEGQVLKHAQFFRNRLVVYELVNPENEKDLNEQVTEYTITRNGELIKGKTYQKLR